MKKKIIFLWKDLYNLIVGIGAQYFYYRWTPIRLAPSRKKSSWSFARSEPSITANERSDEERGKNAFYSATHKTCFCFSIFQSGHASTVMVLLRLDKMKHRQRQYSSSSLLHQKMFRLDIRKQTCTRLAKQKILQLKVHPNTKISELTSLPRFVTCSRTLC